MIPTKKLLIPLVVFLFASSSAIAASWHEKFVSDYKDKGIDEAVEIAVSDKRTPDQIIKTAFPIEGLESKILVKALFCASLEPKLVEETCANNGIDEATIEEGLQLALTECRRKMAEWYNLIPPGDNDLPGNHASPWKFK